MDKQKLIRLLGLSLLMGLGFDFHSINVHASWYNQQPSAHEEYEQDTIFGPNEDLDTTIHKLPDGSMRIALDDFEGGTFWYPNYFSDGNYYKTGHRSDDHDPIKIDGLYRSRLHGHKLTRSEVNGYADHGSDSYWVAHWTYYPGTIGYQNHFNYYQDAQHTRAYQYEEARDKVVFDQANVFSNHTRWVFRNQDVAYQQSEFQPRIWLGSVTHGSAQSIGLDAQQVLDEAPYEDTALNKNGILIYLVRNSDTGHNGVQVMVSKGFLPWITQVMVNQIVQPYQKQLSSSNNATLNQALLAMNQNLTKLIWQKYFMPNLTDVDQYTVGKHISVSAFLKDPVLHDGHINQYNQNEDGYDLHGNDNYAYHNQNGDTKQHGSDKHADTVGFALIFLCFVSVGIIWIAIANRDTISQWQWVQNWKKRHDDDD